MASVVFRNFHIIDAFTDIIGSVFVEGGRIADVLPEAAARQRAAGGAIVFDGDGRLTLTSGFVDMHAHFREGAPPEGGGEAGGNFDFCRKETLESACLAAARGGYTSVVCMANTNPPVDSAETAAAIKRRADALGLINLYPAVSLSEGMAGKRLSSYLSAKSEADYRPPLLSEDGRDVADDALFSAALRAAAERGAVVSCHCDIGGEEAAVERVVRLGMEAGVRFHIAHVSTSGATALLRSSKAACPSLTAEAAPHHIALTGGSAAAADAETFGKVAPPLRGEGDRRAVIEALRSGVIDVIATDHAPHSEADKRGGAPGFSGLETAFAVCNTVLVKENHFTAQKLFSLLSAAPARILGLEGRGFVAKGAHADIVILDAEAEVHVDSGAFASRGKNTLFDGAKLLGRVLLTTRGGKITYHSGVC
ncbi:MAG: dihydroorotase [Spirochaetaceae bacterium]|jgi:dihydroorotase|nr:dihydroorotase [Spirochaetaceae bacterium]